MMKFIKKHFYLFLICLVLFLIPFFWLRPNEMDLGGDSSRLYFYDPVNYLRNSLLYAITPGGLGIEQPLYLVIPFTLLLILMRLIGLSPYIIISLFNGLTLLISFLFMYLIIFELWPPFKKNNENIARQLGAIIASLYYILGPVMVRTAWDKALLTHFQVFLNPLIFYLLLRFVKTNKFIYLLVILLVSFIFSTNFSWAAAPNLLGFYPLGLLFLFIYATYIMKYRFSIYKLIVFGILLFLTHLFHILPLIIELTNKSGVAFTRTFVPQGKFNEGLAYFIGNAPSITLHKNIMGLPQLVVSIIPFEILFVFIPIILVIGLILNKNKVISKEVRYTFLLQTLLFIVSLFLITANITQIGFSFYVWLFSIPGFSMFRNFYGQWIFIYLFFLSLLLGQSIYIVNLKYKRIRKQLFIGLLVLIVASAMPFIRGDMINFIINKNQKIEFKVPISMDPNYEKNLDYIRNLQTDGKFLTLPLTESFNQMLAGTQGGMYQGPSTISLLTQHADFNGYQVLKPFSEVFLRQAKRGDFNSINNLLRILNIRYVYYNSDNLIMDYFPDYPYQHIKKFLPNDQTEYKKFVSQLQLTKLKDFGNKYHIYSIKDTEYLPHIYAATDIERTQFIFDEWGFLENDFYNYTFHQDPRTAYIPTSSSVATSHIATVPDIEYVKVNPTKYYVHISHANSPYLLVLSESFNDNWKVYLTDKEVALNKTKEYFNNAIKEGSYEPIFFNKEIFETWGKSKLFDDSHLLVNGYANAWYIKPQDVRNKSSYTLVLEMTSQRSIYISMLISIISVIISGIIFLVLVYKKNRSTS